MPLGKPRERAVKPLYGRCDKPPGMIVPFKQKFSAAPGLHWWLVKQIAAAGAHPLPKAVGVHFGQPIAEPRLVVRASLILKLQKQVRLPRPRVEAPRTGTATRFPFKLGPRRSTFPGHHYVELTLRRRGRVPANSASNAARSIGPLGATDVGP